VGKEASQQNSERQCGQTDGNRGTMPINPALSAPGFGAGIKNAMIAVVAQDRFPQIVRAIWVLRSVELL